MVTTVREENYQPQVRDTTNGPHLHTYIPRDDGSVLIGGVQYMRATPGVGATTVGVAVAGAAPVIVPAPAPAPTVAVPGVPPTVAVPLNTAAAAQPVVYPQPGVVMPQYVAQPHPVYQPYMMQPQPLLNGAYPGGFPFGIQQPAFGTYGYTGAEMLANQMGVAQNLELNKKQDMKPADNDPMRMYWVRELDGTWTQRNRLTIDSGDIGDCRWYAMDGQFYAVRLSHG